ncbi:MAG: M1 family metallopeptidase [Cyclobacteriaceae bacterium]
MKTRIVIWLALCCTTYAVAQQWQGKFEQLGQMLPTPNEFRTGSGSPGPNYWQQQADYNISVELNDETHMIIGSETITYKNNSPDVLKYLWLQLDQNILAEGNITDRTKTNHIRDTLTTAELQRDLDLYGDYKGGYTIKSVKDASGKDLPYTINHTMMRVDLPVPLKSGQSYSFNVDWSYPVSDRLNEREVGRRGGMEYFPQDDNYIYGITHWFPRMCVYDDLNGWQNKQFIGQGEFALPFGNYKVKITVPADHIVAATGVLQNPQAVLSKAHQERFEQAKKSFDKPVIIATQQEAIQREKTKSKEKKTWEYHADDVRDFAFASSRKFIWDAQAVQMSKGVSLAMSYYPKEGNPLWERESTKAVKNTITTYSKYTIDYPYPVAISVHTANIGMEYPMICFNGGRPNPDGTIPDRTKWAMIGVIVHEVGHNFFPMIINNDERQWAFLDEGFNTFVQYLTQVENYPDMPQRRGPASAIVPYMKGDKSLQRPLMTSAENVVSSNYGAEQYAKCATALNILRETVMGKELFDKAFKEYAQRWAFKHPMPGDFFRTMEDASAVDLDWFWRGWFYSTDHTDQSIDQVKWYRVRGQETNVENRSKNVKGQIQAGGSGNANGSPFDQPEPFSVIPTDSRLYGDFVSRVDDKAILSKMENRNFYEVTLSNKGGLVMPVVIQWNYKDGSREIERIPAEIWRNNEYKVTKVFVKEKEVASVVLDPMEETADINTEDNVFPKPNAPSKFDQLRKKGN